MTEDGRQKTEDLKRETRNQKYNTRNFVKILTIFRKYVIFRYALKFKISI